MKAWNEGPKGINDVVNDQGFAMHYRAISNQSAVWKISNVRESNYKAKQKDGLTSFLILSASEVKIFQYGFIKEHTCKVCVNPQCREMKL